MRDWFHLKSPQALWGLRCAGVLSGVVGASLHRPPGPPPGPQNPPGRAECGGRAPTREAGPRVSPLQGFLGSTAAPGIGGTAGDWLELCRLAVLPSVRGKGVGAVLTAAVERHAMTQNAGLMWLPCVHESPAEAYYRHRGWRDLGPTDFDPPFDVQQEMLLWQRTPGAEDVTRAGPLLDRRGWEPVRLTRL